jgi:hypothetical protein
MGLMDTPRDAAIMHRQREANLKSDAMVELLTELIAEQRQLLNEQRQTNRLLWAALPPQVQAQIQAENEAVATTPSYPEPQQPFYPEPEKKGRWR